MSDPTDWPAAVDAVVESLRDLLGQVRAEDWARPAANVGWDCRHTIEHIGGDFIHCAAQLVSQADDHYVAFSFDLDRARTEAELTETELTETWEYRQAALSAH